MSRGTRNFNRCQVKEVTIHSTYQEQGSSSNAWSRKKPEGVDLSLLRVALVADLDCPRTKGQYVRSHASPDRQSALSNLREVAAEWACGNCVLARKSRSEVDNLLAEEYQARAERLRAEKILLDAEREHAEAVQLGKAMLRQLEIGPQLPELPPA